MSNTVILQIYIDIHRVQAIPKVTVTHCSQHRHTQDVEQRHCTKYHLPNGMFIQLDHEDHGQHQQPRFKHAADSKLIIGRHHHRLSVWGQIMNQYRSSRNHNNHCWRCPEDGHIRRAALLRCFKYHDEVLCVLMRSLTTNGAVLHESSVRGEVDI